MGEMNYKSLVIAKFSIIGWIVVSNVIDAQTYINLEPVIVLSAPPCTVLYSFGVGLAHGDLNGDGYSDLVIGQLALDYNRIYIYFGGPSFDSIPDVVLIGEKYYGFGRPIAVGDVNGDGYDDVIAGGTGRCRVYFGGNPMDNVPDLVAHSPPNAAAYANYVAAGDVNGDGYDDFIVGAPNYPYPYTYGRVYIYFGGANPDTIPDVILNGEQIINNAFGGNLSSGYDVNADGYEDVFVAAVQLYGPGKAFIYFGGNPMDTIPDVVMTGTGPGDFFGEGGFALLHDINGDGYDDAAVGEPLDRTKDTVYVYFGADTMDGIADVILDAEDPPERFGYALSSVEHPATDNFSAIIIGADGYQREGNLRDINGKLYLYCGGDFLDTVYDAIMIGTDSQCIGGRCSSAGDIDGDGIDEFMVSNYAANYHPTKVWVLRYRGEGVEEHTEPKYANLLRCYPNPFTEGCEIGFRLRFRAHVKLCIYDVTGRLVTILVDGNMPPGRIKLRWCPKDSKRYHVVPGVYFCRLHVDGEKLQLYDSKKIVYMCR